MSTKTKIQWTDISWNPVRGCSMVSAGCENCYAMKQAHRFSGKGKTYEGLTELGPHGPRWNGNIRLVSDALDAPLHWKKPRRVFVNSMSDLFHEDVPDEFIDRVFAVMALAGQHQFQVLTKRPERMLAWAAATETPYRVETLKHIIAAGRLMELDASERTAPVSGWPGYFVTSKGRVLSDRTKAGTRSDVPHELKPMPGEEGHSRVMLQVNGTKARPLIHRLVLETFDRPSKDGEQGCHINQDASNNALWNLRWGSQSNNWDDSKRHGTRRRYSKLTIAQVDQLRTRIAGGESASAVAPDFGISDTQARNIARGDQWQLEPIPEWPLPNCWKGVSIEDQATADERIPILLQTPAAVRFVSYEPALAQVVLKDGWLCPQFTGCQMGQTPPAALLDIVKAGGRKLGWAGIDWLIAGGESGPRSRPCDLAWIRSIKDQCQAAGVKCFVKQLGSKAVSNIRTRFPSDDWVRITCLKDKKGGDMAEWPEDLRVREWPQ